MQEQTTHKGIAMCIPCTLLHCASAADTHRFTRARLHGHMPHSSLNISTHKCLKFTFFCNFFPGHLLLLISTFDTTGKHLDKRHCGILLDLGNMFLCSDMDQVNTYSCTNVYY